MTHKLTQSMLKALLSCTLLRRPFRLEGVRIETCTRTSLISRTWLCSKT